MLLFKINNKNMEKSNVRTQKDFEILEAISRSYGIKVLDKMVGDGKITSYTMMDIYCKYDAVIKKNGFVGIVEFKKRKCNSYSYPTVLMEHKKCSDMKKTKADGYYYISIFNDNVASVYRFDNIEKDLSIESKVLPCNHPKIGQDDEIVDKTCYRLPIVNKINI